MNLQRFKDWYRDVLDTLYKNENAGFAILMITFPLLERYLREKSGSHEDKLNRQFFIELLCVFPELINVDIANDFWQVYRNGILHQVTLSMKNNKGVVMPSGWLSNDFDTINLDRNSNFCVHPSKFAQHVVRVIEADFTTFEGRSSPDHPLPTVWDLGPISFGTATPFAVFDDWPTDKNKKGG